MENTPMYSKQEEIANAVIHGIGTLLSIAALSVLVAFASVHGSAWHITSFAIFGGTMILLYACSTIVHSIPAGRAKDVFEILDHSAIYIFIAGTYTPFLLISLKGAFGWSLFGVIWSLAIAGTIFKIHFVKRFMHLSTLLYLAMGWLILLAWGPLVANVPEHGLTFLVIGGVLYSVGAIFFVWRGFRYHHAIWHLFVLAGSVMHFFAVLTLLNS
ncbi:hemolysin III family protein [Aciduricibacillus chroicocephali]|uniref:Hemolysin III family protein n=2 Tax=Aciduricibacillus chroicocephali TaxID=3054939 RepID=A0ABY9KUT3_9BACI|nr:hemolysin III family protein [Bacillaceae bacterium 44XB]